MTLEYPEIVIQVNNLSQCRLFYRTELGLGDPIRDSNVSCTFETASGFRLTLEASEAPYLEHASSAVAWGFISDDAKALTDHLNSIGCEVRLLADGLTYRCADPEGNYFLFRQKR